MGVDEVILDRLDEDNVPEAQANLVLAALISDDELARAVSGEPGARPAPVEEELSEHGEPKRAYLTSIAVEGFRGIGRRAGLTLRPGPGLTLVTGRNGSGKSSFAEAAELALTGDNRRWSGVGHSVEREGWRNLHHAGPIRIDVSLSVDGVPGVTTVEREWAAGDRLDSGQTYARAAGQAREPVASLGWLTAMEVYRPFLSYAELGALVSGKPSQMHDALEAILGLGQLKDADTRLSNVRRELESASKRATQRLPEVQDQLKGNPDARAAAAVAELARRTPDLDALAALAGGGDAPGDDNAGRLRQVTAIALPTIEAVTKAIGDVNAAQAAIAGIAGTPAAEARRVAGLLRTALDHQRDHDGAPCPVCGGRPLDAAWAEAARVEVAELVGVAR